MAIERCCSDQVHVVHSCTKHRGINGLNLEIYMAVRAQGRRPVGGGGIQVESLKLKRSRERESTACRLGNGAYSKQDTSGNAVELGYFICLFKGRARSEMPNTYGKWCGS